MKAGRVRREGGRTTAGVTAALASTRQRAYTWDNTGMLVRARTPEQNPWQICIILLVNICTLVRTLGKYTST